MIEDLVKEFEKNFKQHTGQNKTRDKPAIDFAITIASIRDKMKYFVGQKNIKDAVEIAIIAAAYQNKPLDHMLFTGPPGLGKTTMGNLIAQCLNMPFIETTGQHLSSKSGLNNLVRFIQGAEGFGVIFIDEIHRISKPISEELFSVMQDYRFHGEDIRPFTMIAATTHPGMLLKPLRERFKYALNFQPYKPEDLIRILKIHDKTLDKNVAEFLAQRSKGTPRILLNHYTQVKNVAAYQKIKQPTMIHCQYAMHTIGIDDQGLGTEDREVLVFLKEHGKPIGKAVICSALGVPESDLVQIIEPYLIKKGLINITSRGRILTMSGLSYLRSKKL